MTPSSKVSPLTISMLPDQVLSASIVLDFSKIKPWETIKKAPSQRINYTMVNGKLEEDIAGLT